jgi:hypothetical protein
MAGRYMFTQAAEGISNRAPRVFTPEGTIIIQQANLNSDPELISAVQGRDYKKVDRILSSARVKLQKQGIIQRKRDRQTRRPLVGNRGVFPLPKRWATYHG